MNRLAGKILYAKIAEKPNEKIKRYNGDKI